MFEMLALRDASSKTGLSYNCIRQLCLDEKIKYIRSGVKIYVNMASLIAYCGGEMQDGSAKLHAKSNDFVINK